jgi:hypothetical protein
MPPWGCDREQGGSAPNAVKNSSSRFQGSLAETSVCRAAIRSREAVAHLLELEPNFRITEWAIRTRYRSSKYLLTVCARQDFPNE